MRSGPCILRPPIQPEKCGRKLKTVLKLRDICIENVRMASVMADLKPGGCLKSQGPCMLTSVP